MSNSLKRFRIKLLHWEYWPAWTVYAIPVIYYCYLALRSRAFFFFPPVNPGIETGGMFFESKWEIFKIIPPQFLPKTILIKENSEWPDIKKAYAELGIAFPMIAKPDRGERGQGVKKILDEESLRSYLVEHPVDIIIQEYIDLPLELSVFYIRHPQEKKGQITSLTKKELLHVTGNGKQSLLELIAAKDRAFLQWEVLKKESTLDLAKIPAEAERVLLVPYGNHSRGAMFLNAEADIDDKLLQVFDDISKSIPGFYHGRFDIRCQSMELLKQNKAWKIMELNGAGAEPAHIYDPHFSFFEGQKTIIRHFKKMYEISRYNHQLGHAYMTFSEFKSLRKLERSYKQKLLA
jgi:hypothetical protein